MDNTNEYKFILNNKNVSISIFYIQLNNKSIIKIKAYNEIADICYNSTLKGNIISMQKINSKMEVIINNFLIIE